MGSIWKRAVTEISSRDLLFWLLYGGNKLGEGGEVIKEFNIITENSQIKWEKQKCSLCSVMFYVQGQLKESKKYCLNLLVFP